MNVALIGCGFIGGSIALDLKRAKVARKILGVDLTHEHLEQSLSLGIIDEISSMDEAVFEADLVILAVPVDVSETMIESILDSVGENTTVMDVGSTKAKICNAANLNKNRDRFVATHPIAGTENSGPSAAFTGLYEDKVALICESARSSPEALKLVRYIYRVLGSDIIEMDPDDHDRHLAYVSHLSHISSFTLGLTVLDIEKNEKNINMLAGSGFESTVRLAKSSPEMWAPIFVKNKQDILTALDEYMTHLVRFRQLIADENLKDLNIQMKRANDIRRILKRPAGNAS